MHGHVRVQGDGLRAAGGAPGDRAWLARDQLGDCARVPGRAARPGAAGGVRVLADLAGDLLEMLADDLDLLATKVRAGAAVYDHVESSVVRRVGRPDERRPRRCRYPPDEPDVVSGAAARCPRLAAVAAQVGGRAACVGAGQLAGAWAGRRRGGARWSCAVPPRWCARWSSRCTGRPRTSGRTRRSSRRPRRRSTPCAASTTPWWPSTARDAAAAPGRAS